MTGEQIARLVDQHGGVVRVIVVPKMDRRGRRGWANKLVCADGWARTNTRQEDQDLITFYKARGADKKGLVPGSDQLAAREG